MNFVQGVYRKNRQTGNGVKAEVRTGNLFTEGHFATNEEVEQIREQERMQQDQDILNGIKPVGMSEAEYKQKFREAEQRAKDAEKQNGRQVVDIRTLSQKGLDKRLGGHGGCKFTDYMILAEARMRAESQGTGNFDQDKIYDAAKIEGDKIIEGDFNVIDPDRLLRKAGVKGDISWGRETDPSQFNSTLIEQLDKGNPVMMILDDKHGEIIYGYEKSGDSLRYLVHDVGYQGDTYLNSKTWQPYQETFDGAFTSYKNGKPWKGYRTTTKLLYLK